MTSLQFVLRLTRRQQVRWVLGLGVLAVAAATVVHGATSGGDFRLAVWYPGQAMFHGRDPYDIASFERYYGVHQREAFSAGWFPLYGPIHLWLAVVFGLFPVSVAAGLWFAVNLGGLLAMATVATRALDRRLGGPAILTVTAFLILSRPGRATLEDGQATVIYALLTYVAWSQARRRPWVAAVALACALGKPPFGLPLLALILARRLWPVAVRGVAIGVAASVPIVIWLSINAGSLSAVARAMAHNLRYTDNNPLDAPGSRGRIDALSLLARYVHGSFGGSAEVGAFVVLVGVVAVFIGRASSGRGWPLSPAVLVLLGVVTVLCIAHEYYDLLLLVWPFAAALRPPAGYLIDRALALGRSTDTERAAGPAPTAAPSVGGVGLGVGGLLALCALPALVVTVIPSNDTLKLLGATSSTGLLSTLTTACLLLFMAAALVVIAWDHPQEGSADGDGSGPSVVMSSTGG